MEKRNKFKTIRSVGHERKLDNTTHSKHYNTATLVSIRIRLFTQKAIEFCMFHACTISIDKSLVKLKHELSHYLTSEKADADASNQDLRDEIFGFIKTIKITWSSEILVSNPI